jgi:hypothetical protein
MALMQSLSLSDACIAVCLQELHTEMHMHCCCMFAVAYAPSVIACRMPKLM